MAVEFVKGWHLSNILGEGAFGEVRLLVNIETNECVATKVIDLQKYPNANNQIKKEICIHRLLKHENVIKFYGQRSDDNIEYIFLEYASGGELFDRIEPDVGMDIRCVHRFFIQLISGVEYLHSKGIVHRDLKPENLLLDENDNIKISDFGMSTLFRHSGKERTLTQKCGTVPYMAPEIFIHKEYRAEPADIWSCGVILVTLMSGELPWDKANPECRAYMDWKESKFTIEPWNKIDTLVLSLIRKILAPNVTKRYVLSEIQSHQWFVKTFTIVENQNISSPISKSKRKCTESIGRLSSASQPNNYLPNIQTTSTNIDSLKNVCFSQPAGVDDMFLSTQLNSTPFGSSQTIYQRLVKRMTRFFTKIDSKSALHRLKRLFEKLNYSYKTSSSGQLTVSTIDKRGMPLVFSASVIDMNSNQILVDFRLTKGDGLEFKRHFVNIRNDLCDIVVKGPITWPLAFATNYEVRLWHQKDHPISRTRKYMEHKNWWNEEMEKSWKEEAKRQVMSAFTYAEK